MTATTKIITLRDSDEGIELEIIPCCLEATLRNTGSGDDIEFGSRKLSDFAETIEAWRDLFQAALDEVTPLIEKQTHNIS